MIVFERLDDSSGIESEHLGQVGTLDAPLLAGQDGALFEVGQEVLGPVDLDLGDQIIAERLDPSHEIFASVHGIEGTGVNPAVLMHLKVGVGRLQDHVVLGCLDVPMP